MRKLTLGFAQKVFHEAGCMLLATEYVNSMTKMPYRCANGHEAMTTLDSFQNGHGCSRCAGNEKLTLEFAQKVFHEAGCMLLATEYVNSMTKMPYRCANGHKVMTTLSSFQSGRRCSRCAGLEKLTLEFAQKVFHEAGCMLLATEYVNSRTKMPYRCANGHEAMITLSSFQSGSRCSRCAGNDKHTLEFAQKVFHEAGCMLLATEYVNSMTKMPYRCANGHEAMTTLHYFQSGSRCSRCAGNDKHTLDYVKRFFQSHKCVLLAREYVDSKTLMPYICECKKKSVIRFASFQQGKRCHDCARERRWETRRLHDQMWDNADLSDLEKKIDNRSLPPSQSHTAHQ